MEFLLVLIGVMLAAVSYISTHGHRIDKTHRIRFLSFSTGAFLTYLILDLLPIMFKEEVFLDRVASIGMIAGFSAFHLLERVLLRLRKGESLKRDLKELHAFGLFFYHVIIGVVMVAVFEEFDTFTGLLFILPIIAIMFVSSLSLRNTYLRTNVLLTALLSLSPLIGILLASALPISPFILQSLLGIVAGSMLFTVITDAVPKEREGEPLFFLLGAIIYGLIISVTWFIAL